MTHEIPTWDSSIIVANQQPGEGNPLVFVHGWSCNQTFWQPLLEQLPNRHIITLDLAGHGESSIGLRQGTIDEFAQDVLAVTHYFDLNDYQLVGHSMGGMVALHAASTQKSRISATIQLDTSVLDYGYMPDEQQQAVLDGFNADFPDAVKQLVQNTAGNLAQEEQQWIVDQMVKTDPGMASEAFKHYMQYDPLPATQSLHGKLFWLSSGIINSNARVRYAPHLGAEYVLPQLGHFLVQQNPQQVTIALESLLSITESA